ncbi:type VI secretion system-associated protein TagO, partial [Klebsiella pneumoniae]|nr:type VI secretion system-associated protein TagO [Klebsiella pneumoniae]
RLDPVLCRDHEIDLMIDILCRRRKNNPVVVGEAGVGKSALIEGLALRIVAGQVPGERPTVVITTPAIGHVPPRPVLMFSCVDNITRM